MVNKKEEISEMNNILRIGRGDTDKVIKYIYGTILRMRPKIYDKYDCIIWQIKGSDLAFAINYLYPLVYHTGLEIDGEPVKKKIKAFSKEGEGYSLGDAYEIKLKKIPAIRFLKEL